HVAPRVYDAEARKKLKARIQGVGVTLVCLAGYPDFTARADKAGMPSPVLNAIHVGELARLARALEVPIIRAFAGFERPGLPFGTGFIDYKSFFQALKDSGSRGYVAYEMCEVLEGGGSIENLDSTARAFLKAFADLAK